ncbi:MAG: PQQ-dependent sugar dehydrogenase [Chitinophagaceae bacterium]
MTRIQPINQVIFPLFLYLLIPVGIFFLSSCQWGHGNIPLQIGANLKRDSLAGDSVRLQLVTHQVEFPVALVASPDGSRRSFVCELSGKIWILEKDSLLPQPFLDLSAKVVTRHPHFDEKGLYSIAFPPEFATNGKFYVYYDAPADRKGDRCKLVLDEFKVRKGHPNQADPFSQKRVWEMESPNIENDGCQIAFGPDGYLYIGIGDIDTVTTGSGRFGLARNLGSWGGKILRIDVNHTPYGIPKDNPFVGKGVYKPEIWAYGFRRPWRFCWDPHSQVMMTGDVGDHLWEETDQVQKGGDYGWRVMEGPQMVRMTKKSDTAGMIAPVDAYNHQVGIAVIGGYFYNGKDIPSLLGKYVFGDYNGPLFYLDHTPAGKWIRHPLQVIGEPSPKLLIYSFGQDAEGEMYVLGNIPTAQGFKGAIYRIVHP